MAKEIKVGKKYVVTSYDAHFPRGTVVRAIDCGGNDGFSTACTTQLHALSACNLSDEVWHYVAPQHVKRLKKSKALTNGLYTVHLTQVQAEYFLAAMGAQTGSHDKVIVKEFANAVGIAVDKLESFHRGSYDEVYNTTMREELQEKVLAKYLTKA